MHYALACRGQVGIAGMPAEEAGPLREGEQRRSAAIVGVDNLHAPRPEYGGRRTVEFTMRRSAD